KRRSQMTTRTIMLSLCLLSICTLASAQETTFGGVPLKDCPPMSERMKKLTPKEKANLTRDPSTITPEELKTMQQEAIEKAPGPEHFALNPPCKQHEKDKEYIEG